MGAPQNSVWGVGFGSDNNGGGFVVGTVGGVDYSWQPAPQLAVTDGVANGSTTITTATGGVTASMVGSFVCLEGGSTALARTRRYITAVTDANTFVVDTLVAAGTGITTRIGGAILTFGELLLAAPRGIGPGHIAWCYGTIPTAVQLNTTATVATVSNTAMPIRIRGCGINRGDGGFCTLQATASLSNLLNSIGSGYEFTNMIFDGASKTNTALVATSGSYMDFFNCQFKNSNAKGLSLTGATCRAYSNVISGCGVGLYMMSGNIAVGNTISGNSSHGIQALGPLWVITHNHICGNGGDAINANGYGYVDDNNCYNNGTNGFNSVGTSQSGMFVLNNFFDSNVGIGMKGASGPGYPASPWFDGNEYHGNGSATSNIGDTGSLNQMDLYAFKYNQNPTTTPYNNAAGQDFGPNAIATGGALVRGVAMPQFWPGIVSLNKRDMGPTQHPDAGGGGGGGGGNIIYV